MRVKQAGHFFKQLPAWFSGRGPDSDIVISTRISVARNLANHRFTPRASLQERTKIFNKIAESLESLSAFKVFKIINFTAISSLKQQLLAEKRIATTDLLDCEGDRGIAHDNNYRITMLINAEDHLCFCLMDSGFCSAEMWKLIDSIEGRLGRKLDFAFDRGRGFLTCRPVNSGTGLCTSFLMHLPGLVLTRSIETVLQGVSQMGFSAKVFFNGNSGVTGNFFLLSNYAGSGIHEIDSIDNSSCVIAEVVRCEREARQRLVAEARLELTDRIFRAYGILRYARTLSIAEYLNLSSALRLGCDVGIFTGIALTDFNRAMLFVMPAHLQYHLKKTMNTTECNVARAESARRFFKNGKNIALNMK
jgi:protein arginine kinase